MPRKGRAVGRGAQTVRHCPRAVGQNEVCRGRFVNGYVRLVKSRVQRGRGLSTFVPSSKQTVNKMKTTFLTTLASLAVTQFALVQEPAPRVALSIGAVNSYRFHAGSSRLANYDALGSKVNLVFHDTWLLGFTQLTSVAPGNLLPGAELGPGNTRLSEYALTGGSKWRFAPKAYTQGSLKAGIGRLSVGGGVFEDKAVGAHVSFVTVGAEAGIGYHLSKYFALEAEAGYQRYFNNDRWPVAAKELNNLSAQISLVGTFGLTKQR